MERMNRPVLSAERRLPAADFLERVRAALVGLVDARGLALEARVRRGGSIGLDGLEAAVSRGVELADKFGRTRVKNNLPNYVKKKSIFISLCDSFIA